MSFDVGIKHMALCTMDVDESGTQSIHEWNVLDLTGHVPIPTVQCTCTTKTGQCKVVAKYKKLEQYYCARHAKAQVEFRTPDKKFSHPELKKKKVAILHEMGLELNLWTCREKYSHTKMIELLTSWSLDRCLEPLPVSNITSSTKMDLITIGRNMATLLDRSPYLSSVTHVCIENQISPIAGRMKTLQGMLAQYFILRCPTSHIAFVSSINKLKAFKQEEVRVENIDTYKKHKKDAIKYTLRVLETQPQFQSHLSVFQNYTSTKKDDLADCFLQGLWYCSTL